MIDNDYGYIGLCPDNIGTVATIERTSAAINTDALLSASHGEHLPDEAA